MHCSVRGKKKSAHCKQKSQVLITVAEEIKSVFASSVIPSSGQGVQQHTASVIIWLAARPVWEGVVTPVRPFQFTREQTDPERGLSFPVFPDQLLHSLIFGLTPHTDQVVSMQSAIFLGFRPSLCCKNGEHHVGTTCKDGKKARLECDKVREDSCWKFSGIKDARDKI